MRFDRQQHAHPRALAFLAGDRDLPLVLADDLFADIQAKPGAHPTWLGGEVGVEDVLEVLLRDPAPAVRDGHLDRLAIFRQAAADHDDPIFRLAQGVPCVDQQVKPHVFQLAG